MYISVFKLTKLSWLHFFLGSDSCSDVLKLQFEEQKINLEFNILYTYFRHHFGIEHYYNVPLNKELAQTIGYAPGTQLQIQYSSWVMGMTFKEL